MPECVLCRQEKTEESFSQPDVALVCIDCMELHQFQKEDLTIFRKHQRKMELTAPTRKAPSTNANQQEVFATDKAVTCPNQACRKSFEINPWFYDTIAECPSCGQDFIIRPPKEATWLDALPANHPARQSGLAAKRSVRSKHELPQELEEAGPSLPSRKLVTCPECKRKFPVLESALGYPITCPKCKCEFQALS